MTEADVSSLLNLERDELVELLGMQAVPLLASPVQAHQLLENDSFKVEYEAILGNTRRKRKPVRAMVELGDRFLKIWGNELRNAICKNDDLH